MTKRRERAHILDNYQGVGTGILEDQLDCVYTQFLIHHIISQIHNYADGQFFTSSSSEPYSKNCSLQLLKTAIQSIAAYAIIGMAVALLLNLSDTNQN